MNSDSQKSCQPCGCDEGAFHICAYHMDIAQRAMVGPGEVVQFHNADAPTRPQLFPESAQGRKDHPVFTGFILYFPDAIAAIARVSKKGNDQHNPGQKLHWSRNKSTDQMDTATRHMMDHGVGTTKDTDGEYHLAKAAWRLCAELQLTIEKEREG